MTDAQPAGPGSPSYLYRLIERELKAHTDYDSLATYLEEARKADLTFMIIAENLRNATGVYVTNESVRRWFRNIEAGRPADADVE